MQTLNEDLTQAEPKFKYMMLGRLQMDLDYYFGCGNRSNKPLFYDTIEEHLIETEKLLKSFPIGKEPDWFSMEDIKKYKEFLSK